MSQPSFNNPFERAGSSRDQQFNLPLDPLDIISNLIPLFTQGLAGCPRYPRDPQASQKDSGSTVCSDKDKFQVNLDVQHFKPEEISVKVNDSTITVEGKHEEREDEHGSISRHFVRKYVVPKGHNVDNVESKMSSDGVLTITAPRIKDKEEECKSIPVVQTGRPSKAVGKKE